MRLRGEDPVNRWIALRPLALGTACFLLGLIAGHAAPGVPVWGLAALGLAALLPVFRKKALIFALILPLGAMWISLRMIRPALPELEEALLTGRVDSDAVVSENRVRLLLTDASLDGEALPCRVMLYLYDMEEIPPFGAEIAAQVRTWRPSGAGNPGGFDYGAWLWRQGAALCASAGASNVLSVEPPQGFSPAGWLHETRARLTALIGQAFDGDCAGVVTALITGDRSGLSEETWENYRASGVSHLLALSGLHVGALFLLVEWLLMRLRLSRRAAFFAALPFMAAYALLVGAPASVLRACLMLTAARTARFDGRPRDGLSVMCLSMLPLLIINPLYIEDTGFVMSYSAVAGLALFARPAPEGRGRAVRFGPAVRLRQAARASLAAQLGTIPAAACFFNQLPVWFLPFNVILAPLMVALFPLLLAAVGLTALCAPLSFLLIGPAQALLRLFARLTGWGARMPWAVVNVADWPAWLVALYAVAAFIASPYVRVARRGVRRAGARAGLAVLIALSLCLPALTRWVDGVEITFLDVGEGDAAVIRTEDRVYLMDVGEDDTAARYLLDQGLSPDGVFLSHGHSDHAGGLSALADCFPPCPLYVSCVWERDGLDESVEAAWRKALDAGWPVVRLAAGDELALSGAASLRVWHPAAEGDAGLNENSLVCGVSFGLSMALFTGDLPSSQEWMPLPDCTVLKAAHHGSRTSTGALLLTQTTPSVAVVSVGHNNFGHPAPEVLERLASAAVYRTDLCGAITVSLGAEGETRVRTWRGE